MRRFLPSGFVCGAALLAGACGSSSSEAAPATVCDLLAQPEAAVLWGGPLGPAQGSGGIHCSFDANHVAVVEVTRMDEAAFTRIGGMSKFSSDTAGQETIPDLGDLARYHGGADSGEISVAVRGMLIVIGVKRSANPRLRSALIQTARDMLTQM